MLIRQVSIMALLVLLAGCEGPRGPSVIEAGGANPCGPCEKDEYCSWSDGASECTVTGCERIPTYKCAECFGTPSKCDARALAECTNSGQICELAEFEHAELADDGEIVVYCSEVNDTGCST